MKEYVGYKSLSKPIRNLDKIYEIIRNEWQLWRNYFSRVSKGVLYIETKWPQQ